MLTAARSEYFQVGIRNRLEFIYGLLRLDSHARGFLHTSLNRYNARLEGECPCCGFKGKFRPQPLMGLGSEESCPVCNSLGRQRLFAVALQRGFVNFKGKDVLHFAPDRVVVELAAEQGPSSQMTADLEVGRADTVLNIESIDLKNESIDLIVCSHVLEHVDYTKALTEMHRVLRANGSILIMIPIIEGWTTTYENTAVRTPEERERHFGQWDHVRYFGSDFREKVNERQFSLTEFTADGPDSARYKLFRGEKVFLATKRSTEEA